MGIKAFDQACRALKAALDDYQEKIADMELYMTVFQLKEGIRYAGTIIYRCLYRVLSLTGNRNLMSILKVLWVKERAERLNPLRTFNENGIVVSCGSDAPCITGSYRMD